MGPLDRGSAPSGFVASLGAPWRVAFNPGSEVFRVPPSLKMAAAEEDELPLPRLPELFDISRRLLDEVEVATEPTGTRAVQEKVLKGLQLLKQAAEMLAQLDLFRYGERVIADNVGNNGYQGWSLWAWVEETKTKGLSCLPPIVISCILFTFSTSLPE